VNDTLFVLPVAPPYGAYFQFAPGYEPVLADVTATGDAPAVSAFAGRYNVYDGPRCCAEQDPANRIVVRADLTATRGVLATVDHPIPSGHQVMIGLDLGALYASRIRPCTLPSSWDCEGFPQGGLGVRFYVGAGPDGAPPPHDPGQVPDGACLLEYNTALTSGDPCCYRKNGPNTCDRDTACNGLSGADCCLVYGTQNTSGGQRCCLYETGAPVDGSPECARLLGESR
jgi:hypothetical protein